MESVPSALVPVPRCPMTERHIAPDAVCALERQYRLQWEPAQESFVLLYPEGMIKLSGSAAEIMQRVDGKTTASGIVHNLEQAFPGVQLRQDVMDFLEVAHAKGWIRARQAK
jgi:pyrroloquinoline quinone biosynthesis protein D